MVENPIKLEDVKDMERPQCPECGYWNVKIIENERVDFYGVPVVFHCDCGWEKEITEENL